MDTPYYYRKAPYYQHLPRSSVSRQATGLSRCTYVMLAWFVVSFVVFGIVMGVIFGGVRTPQQAPVNAANYGATVRFPTLDYSPVLLNNSSANFSATQDLVCQQMLQILQKSAIASLFKNCSVLIFRSGSLIADSRLTLDFNSVGGDSVSNSQLLRTAIVNGITNNANTIPMDKNTVIVTAQWPSTGVNVCESTRPCDQICVPTTLQSYYCVCSPGYSLVAGAKCTANNMCSTNPCLNNGDCIPLGTTDFQCSCVVPYTGKDCSQVVDTCGSNPCASGGICISTSPSGYVCVCSAGYTGPTCLTNINECASSPCMNGGVCVDMVNGYSCNCSAGYIGHHCETDVDRCASSPCMNGGSCISGIEMYTCICNTLFTGAMCQTRLTELFCAASVSANDVTNNLAFVYDEVFARRAPTYYANLGIYQPSVNGTFFSHLSLAVPATSIMSLYATGPPPDLESTSIISFSGLYNGVITTSHTYMLQLSQPNQVISTTVSVSGTSSPYSDSTGKQTSWSAVRLEDFLSQPMVAFAATYTDYSYSTLGIIQFDMLDIDTGGAFNMTTWTFNAPFSGVYVLGITAASDSGSKPVDITINVNGSVVFELIKLSFVTSTDYRETVSRTMAITLNANDKVTANLVYGGFYSDNYRHTAFTGFLYQPLTGLPNVIWSVHRTTNVTSALSPVTFDTVDVNVGGGWNSSTNTFTAPYSGIYQLHLTATMADGSQVKYELMWNGAPYANVLCNATNYVGVETRSRGIMVDAKAGDTLYIATDSTTRLYSNNNRLISFTGFFVSL